MAQLYVVSQGRVPRAAFSDWPTAEAYVSSLRRHRDRHGGSPLLEVTPVVSNPSRPSWPGSEEVAGA